MDLSYVTRVEDGFFVELLAGGTNTVGPTTSPCLPESVPLSTGSTRGLVHVSIAFLSC